MKRFRNHVRYIHKEFDAFVGWLFSNQKPLKNMCRTPMHDFSIENNSFFAYSRKDHFSMFHLMPVHKNQNPATCDLKVYQDLFVYSFIIENIPKGAKILEIGGGESRIIDSLNKDFEFWNLDRLEGQGHGPKSIFTTDGFFLVRDNIGNFSDELPEDYFDLIFSISVVEHFLEDEESISNILLDMERIMKKDAWSLHCVDSLLFKDHVWFHPLVHKIADSSDIINLPLLLEQIYEDDHLWVLPKYAYFTRWFPKTKSLMKSFGQPFSLNLIWRNSN